MYSSTNAPTQQAAYMPENNLAMGGLSKGLFEPRPRKRMNIVPVAIALFLPWALFVGVFALLSFSLHYTQSTLTTFLVFLCLLLHPLLLCALHLPSQSLEFSLSLLFVHHRLVLLVGHNDGPCQRPALRAVGAVQWEGET